MTDTKATKESKPKSSAINIQKNPAEEWKKESRAINKLMIEFAVKIAERAGARALFIYSDACAENAQLEKLISKINIILVTKKDEQFSPEIRRIAKHILKIPNINLTRMGCVKVAALMAINADLLEQGDKAVFLTGIPEMGALDSFIILDLGREFEVISSAYARNLSETIKPAIFEAALNLAIELGHQGREGKSVGTTFVIGDVETVLNRSRQLTINPFKGYSEEDRNILDPEVRNTLKEFSSIDGAFVIREDGVVVTAGRHLNAAFESEIPQGLGSRHASAAGITSVTNATAIVVSESTGDVRIFREGKIFLTIEKSAR